SPPPETYTLSLHDALPIFAPERRQCHPREVLVGVRRLFTSIGVTLGTQLTDGGCHPRLIVDQARDLHKTFKRIHKCISASAKGRSEEHTSELQSRENLVCR